MEEEMNIGMTVKQYNDSIEHAREEGKKETLENLGFALDKIDSDEQTWRRIKDWLEEQRKED